MFEVEKWQMKGRLSVWFTPKKKKKTKKKHFADVSTACSSCHQGESEEVQTNTTI